MERNQVKDARQIQKIAAMSMSDMCKAYDLTSHGKGDRQFWTRKGKTPVLLVAHVDHYGTGKVSATQDIDTKEIMVWGEALDDRLGVWMALELLKDSGCSVLLCDHEESGKSTATEALDWVLKRKFNWIMELDRAGLDYVTYNGVSNKTAETYLKNELVVGSGMGSFSDIAELTCGAFAFNLGIGYYGQHGPGCHAAMVDVYTAGIRAKAMLRKFAGQELLDEYDYTKDKWGSSYFGGKSKLGSSYDWDEGWEKTPNGSWKYVGKKKKTKPADVVKQEHVFTADVCPCCGEEVPHDFAGAQILSCDVCGAQWDRSCPEDWLAFDEGESDGLDGHGWGVEVAPEVSDQSEIDSEVKAATKKILGL